MTETELEGALIDVVVRHGVGPIGLSVDAFNDPYYRSVWAALLDVWATGDTPSVRRVHAHLLQRGAHRNDYDGHRLAGIWPYGHLADLEDLVAILAENYRRRRTFLERRWVA